MNRQQQIEALIQDEFSSEYLDVMNESHMHNVPPQSETHFKVTLVSNDFIGKSKVARHQKVYSVLGGMMQEGLHALALHTYTLEEWQLKQQQSPDSPNCMGGSKDS